MDVSRLLRQDYHQGHFRRAPFVFYKQLEIETEAIMKTLLLLRHAKSSWSNDKLSDFDRPLNDRGLRDAPRMGKLIKKQDLVPDLIISSPARRAARTAELVALEMSYESDIRFTEKLYLAESETYFELARQTDETIGILMLVGHNPGIEQAVTMLTDIEELMPTAALACIRLPIAMWSELKVGKGYKLEAIWRPKEL